MITALVIILLFGGGLGSSLNLSDPAVLQEFNRNVSSIIPDPQRAANVSYAVQQLNAMSWQARNPTGLIEKEIQDMRVISGNYESTPEQMGAAFQELEIAINRVNQSSVQGREVIRENTTKGEWKKLLKSLTKK